MKAVEFIGIVGWDRAIELVNECPERMGFIGKCGFQKSEWSGFCCKDDLKKYTDAYELVKDLYGINKAKEYADSEYTAPELSLAIKQAITLVEEIGECDEND